MKDPDVKLRLEKIRKEKQRKIEREDYRQVAFNNHFRYMGVVALIISLFFLLLVLVGVFTK